MPYTLSNAIIRNKDIAGKYKEITQYACNVVNKEKENFCSLVLFLKLFNDQIGCL